MAIFLVVDITPLLLTLEIGTHNLQTFNLTFIKYYAIQKILVHSV